MQMELKYNLQFTGADFFTDNVANPAAEGVSEPPPT